MRKISFILLMFIAFSINASAQWTEFPVGYSTIPESKLKGSVHSVLTIEQRGEHVFSTIVDVYDKGGKLIERLSSNANIEVHSSSLYRSGHKTTFTYDSSGKLVKEKYFTPEGEYRSYSTYVYDSKNFLVEEVTFDTKGKETFKSTYTYFPEKRQVEVRWSTMKVLLTHNEKNQWIKRAGNGEVDFEYDKIGNLVKESKGRSWHNYSYRFDKQGNWIERENTYVQFGTNGEEEAPKGWMNEYRVITYYSDNETKP